MSERIEGVPPGTKLVRIGKPMPGEMVITSFGLIREASANHVSVYPIIVPDNPYNVIDLATVPIPEGWERDGNQAEDHVVEGVKVKGWFRDTPEHGSETRFISRHGEVSTDHAYCIGPDRRRIHVRKIQPKTRRVLVETTERVHSIGTPQMTQAWAEYLTKCHSGRYRFEERPCE